MADGNTVDNLQIEIEASSAEAEKKIDALAAALERLKKATTGFGNVGDRIREIGASASDSPATTKTQKRKEALSRATREISPTSIDIEKTGSQIEATDRKIEKAKESISELNEQIRMLGFAQDKEKGAQAIEQLNKQLLEQQGILDGLIQKREKLSSLMINGATKEPKQTVGSWAEIKAQLKGSTLGSLVVDTGSVDEAVSRMVDLNDQTSLLNIKLDGLQEKLRGAFEKGNQSQVANYTAQIQKLKDKIAELNNTPVGAKDSDVEYVESETSSVEKETSLHKKLDILKSIKNVLGDIGSSKIKELIPASAAKEISAVGGSLSGMSGALGSIAAAAPAVIGAITVISTAIKTVWGWMKKFNQEAVSAFKTGISAVAGVFEKAAEAAKKFAGAIKDVLKAGIGKLGEGLKSIGKSVVSKFTKPFTDAISAVKKWKDAFGRVAFYRVVREAIKQITDGFKEGKENLYQYSRMIGTEFAPAMNSLATSAQYLKNSFAAMVAPLIQALAPVVDMLVEKFVALLNVIGKVFAMLTGKTVYTQAKKQAVEYGEAANKAAKATKDFLLGIDELNVISKDTGGGAGSADFGSMFEEVEIPVDQLDWVKDIRDAIEGGEWRVVGELIAKKLNDLLDSWDSYAWGKKLGKLINNALNVAYGFLKTFDFEKFGSKIADGLNGLFDEIDWDLLGRTFAAGLNGLFNFIYGFSKTLRWKDIGHDISTAVNGFWDELDATRAAEAISLFVTGIFDMLNTAISEIHWDVLGTKLGEFLNNIDWYGIVYGALSLITNALNALKVSIDSFLAEWDWEDQAEQIYTAINKAFADMDWPGLGRSLGDFFATTFNFLRETVSGIGWYEIGQDIADFILKFDFVDALGSLADLIAAGINAAIKTVQGWLDKIMPEAFNIGRGIAERIKKAVMSVEWGDLGTAIGDGIQTALSFVAGLLNQDMFYEIGKAIGDFLINLNWPGIVEGLGNALANAINSAIGLVKGLLEKLTPEKIEEIATGIAQKINEFVEKVNWEELGQTIHDGISAALDFLLTVLDNLNWDEIGDAVVDFLSSLDWNELLRKWGSVVGKAIGGALKGIDLGDALWLGNSIIDGLWRGMINKWDESGGILGWIKRKLFEPFINGFKSLFGIHSPSTVMEEQGGYITAGLLNGISNGWNDIVSFLEGKVNGIIETVSGTWENIQQTASQKWEEIKTTLGETWDNIKTSASEKFEAVKEKISVAWENVQKATKEKWDNIKSVLSETWDNLKSSATEKFENIKTAISTAWENVKTATSEKWESIKSTLGNIWDHLKTTAGTVFENIKSTVAEKWESIRSDTSEKWDKVKSTLSDAWDSMKSTATSKLADIKSSISSTWSDIVSSAKNWGSDLCDNLASGIRSGIGWVKGAVSDLADWVSSYIHFSEPDIGPLSDFHTYMPDMLGLMAKGIKDNSYLAINAASDLSDTMSRTLGNIEPIEPKFSNLPNQGFTFSTAAIEGRMETANYSAPSSSSTGGSDNSDVINALNAGFQALIETINSQDYGTYLDGKTLMQSVERAQRQRGADIMGGGVNG